MTTGFLKWGLLACVFSTLCFLNFPNYYFTLTAKWQRLFVEHLLCPRYFLCFISLELQNDLWDKSCYYSVCRWENLGRMRLRNLPWGPSLISRRIRRRPRQLILEFKLFIISSAFWINIIRICVQRDMFSRELSSLETLSLSPRQSRSFCLWAPVAFWLYFYPRVLTCERGICYLSENQALYSLNKEQHGTVPGSAGASNVY